MRTISMLLLTGLVALAGCGDDGSSTVSTAPPAKGGAAVEKEEEAATQRDDATITSGKGTAIALNESQFGPMLVDGRRQAIYIFENDPKGKTVCDGECAEAWPPVFTKGDPRAAKGVRGTLLGTVKRHDGRLQVTYAGKPLYFYAHEDPGVVLCHNVKLNGGLWWVVGPDGRRRP
jgi:predicted lipoprotein with Yx(FWY)xxD motif